MAISADVKSQLFRQSSSSDGEKLIRLPHDGDVAGANGASSNSSNGGAPSSPQNASNGKAWTREEHDRFLEGLELFPSGPWKEVAAFVGTRTTRQTMTHAQKYREKIARRKRGLRGSATAAQRAPLQVRKEQSEEAPSAIQIQVQSIEAPLTFGEQLKQVQSSPTSVVLKAEQMLEDPLDFDGCFMELDHESHYQFGTTDFALDQTLLVSLAASEGASDQQQQQQQLSLSDEEMDLIMDSVFTSSSSASTSAAAAPSSVTRSALQNAFSFVC